MPTNYTDTPSTSVIFPVSQTNAKAALYVEVLKAVWTESGRVFLNPELLAPKWTELSVILDRALNFPRSKRIQVVQSRVSIQ